MGLILRLILIVIAVIAVGVFVLVSSFGSCTSLSDRVCNSEEKCCYQKNVPISCSGFGKDIAYYEEKGYISFGDIPREEALKLLNEEEGAEWTYCTENLP